jgi:hypothetical protein
LKASNKTDNWLKKEIPKMAIPDPAKLDEEEMARILDRILHDPSYPELLETDPMAALEVAGWTLTPEQQRGIETSGTIAAVIGDANYAAILVFVREKT